MIRDFKKVLAERKRPGYLVILNRIVSVIILITITLSTVDFMMKLAFLKDFGSMSMHSLMSEVRTINYI